MWKQWEIVNPFAREDSCCAKKMWALDEVDPWFAKCVKAIEKNCNVWTAWVSSILHDPNSVWAVSNNHPWLLHMHCTKVKCVVATAWWMYWPFLLNGQDEGKIVGAVQIWISCAERCCPCRSSDRPHCSSREVKNTWCCGSYEDTEEDMLNSAHREPVRNTAPPPPAATEHILVRFFCDPKLCIYLSVTGQC